MCAAGRHIGRPLQGWQRRFVFWWGCDCFVRAAGGACPAPTKVPDDPRTQERSVTWRSGLFISVTYMNTFMRIPGPGPQARCGKGVWSPEDQGDRCRVPRSFGPSGAGGEQRASLRRTQYDDQTRGKRRCGGYTSSVGCADTFPSRGRQGGKRRCGGYTSSVGCADTFPSRGRQGGTRPAGLHLIRPPDGGHLPL